MKQTFYRRHEGLILGGAAVLLAMAAWQALWSSGRISPLFFTGPSAVAVRFREEWTHGRLKDDLLYSGLNFAIGVGLAVAAGVVLGVVIGWYRKLAMIFEPFVNALYATPRVALVPLILIWFGIGMWSKVFIVFINAFFPVLINTIGGIRATDADLLRAARAFCASDWQIFKTVAIPGAVPSSSPASASPSRSASSASSSAKCLAAARALAIWSTTGGRRSRRTPCFWALPSSRVPESS